VHARPVTSESEHRPSGLLLPFLRVPLFHKIVLANLALLGLGILGGVLVIPKLSPSGEGLATAALAVVILLIATLVNILLVRAALSPIHSLQETALRVEAGDETARAESTGIADSQVTGLVRVFNRMLDHQEALRLSDRDRAGRVLKQMDAENTRSSYELYDNLAQLLAGVLLRLRVLDQTPALQTPEWDENDRRARKILDEIRSQVLEVLEGARGIARRLHPPELKELGLGYALDALARSIADDTGLSVDVHAKHTSFRISDDARLAAFRVTEEALRNAAAHAQASGAVVTLKLEDEILCLEIRDDGTGFDTVAAVRGKTGLGLSAMIERATQVGGTVDIESHLGAGSCVRLKVPLVTSPTTQSALTDLHSFPSTLEARS
jgi:two-component system, NarL family, sensor histidine kinase UhpB